MNGQRIIVEVMDGADGELIGYAVCRVLVQHLGSGVEHTDWRLEPEVYGTRSQAAAAI